MFGDIAVPDENPTLADFIELGQVIFHLRNPQASNVNGYSADAQKLASLLQRCRLPRTATVSARLDGAVLRYFPRTGGIHPSHVGQLQVLIDAISTVLYDEVRSKSLIISDDQDVPGILNGLHSQLGLENLEPHQEALRQDVITCFKANAFRPAIIVAWALGFDLIRSWIYSDSTRLADFNQVLVQRTQKTAQRKIDRYQDFFLEKEAFILDICRDAAGSLQGFTGKTHRLLENLLDDRNLFAHANYDHATEHEAKTYVDRLFRVLAGPPFV